MDSGFINLYRKIQHNDLWLSEPFTKGQAWVDLLLLANHKRAVFFKRGIEVQIERGEVGWSQKALGIRWQWSRKKVNTYFLLLARKKMIMLKTEHEKIKITSIITIVNYESYNTKGHEKNMKRTSKEHERNTNNNVNKNKELKEVNISQKEKAKGLLKENQENHFPSLRENNNMHSHPIASPLQPQCDFIARKGKERKQKEKKGKDIKNPQPKIKFLDFVFLSKEEHGKLVELLTAKGAADYLERLNNYMGSKGKKYKSHYHTILSWVRKDNDLKSESTKPNTPLIEILT